ncbi:UNVERIFIED_CONTAM: hypothetical protein Slati_3475800 [Sesamum latifolium]|uniref:Integrase zinc-binding domain-containing protein n=1 Tax=Sesamum latifolium TaxID=2727402 RepID=A0AAW2UGN5_9LAMI
MGPPTNINEVQRLIGRIAALSRFISKSAEKGLPFFKTLRKVKNFEWTKECQQAFEDLKTYLAKLPLLVKPVPGDTLYLYISSTPQGVSSVLVREEEADSKASKWGVQSQRRKHGAISPANRELKTKFKSFQLQQIPREENVKADSLFKLASALENCKTRRITVQHLPQPRIPLDIQHISSNNNDWLTPIVRWIDEGHLPRDRWEANKIKTRAICFLMQGGMLYKKSYTHPLLRCLSQEEGLHVLKEIHDGCCGSHIGTWALTNKAMRAGYFWPTMKQDARYLLSKCEKCQKHATLIHQPAEPPNVMLSPCPFSQWGMDIVGPFPLAPGQKKFLLFAIDYFTKWVEAEPLACITEGEANGQIEVTNRILVQGIKKRLDRARGTWVEKLTSVLWSYRTTPRGFTGESPFTLVYETEAIIPAELGMPSHRIFHFDEEHNSQLLKEHLDLVDELRETTFIRTQRYKSTMINAHNKRVKARHFQVGDLVLRRIDTLKPVGKLDPKWKVPYKITKIIGNGAYELEDTEGRV